MLFEIEKPPRKIELTKKKEKNEEIHFIMFEGLINQQQTMGSNNHTIIPAIISFLVNYNREEKITRKLRFRAWIIKKIGR